MLPQWVGLAKASGCHMAITLVSGDFDGSGDLDGSCACCNPYVYMNANRMTKDGDFSRWRRCLSGNACVESTAKL